MEYFTMFAWPWSKSEEINEEEAKEEKNLNPFHAENIVGLEEKLQKRIIGQNQAIKMTVEALKRYAIGLNNKKAPIASLLYIGPSGVGKSQLAKELAKTIFGSENYLITLNMSEFSEQSSVYRILGTPPGYVHHEFGGQFTEALKKNSFAIVLLDEIERAHPTVLRVLSGILNEGFITDAQGTLIDCHNMIFIATTNVAGSDILTHQALGLSDQKILKSIELQINRSLPQDFMNRLQMVLFKGIKENDLNELIYCLLWQATEEVINEKQISIDYDESVYEFIRKKAPNSLCEARFIKQVIDRTFLRALGESMNQKYIEDGATFTVSYCNGHFVIQNSQKNDPFYWKYNEDEKNECQIPFQLDHLLDLEDRLQKKIVGQPYAIKITVAALMRFLSGLGNPNSPIGTFLYVGPTGVGKTQLAKELAEELLGSSQHLIRLDMSEYSEPYNMTRLIGSSPGYIHYDEGGQLTEALKKHPYAVVLLDEIEKAHPTILKTFLQVFDEGRITDAKGIVIDCRQMIFILTTNVASQKILSLRQEGCPECEILSKIKNEIISRISPELYNRLEAAPFMGLGAEELNQLVKNMLRDVQNELLTKKGIFVDFDVSLLEFLQTNGFDYELGARPLKRIIQQTVVTELAKKIIEGKIKSNDKVKIFYLNEQIVIKNEIDELLYTQLN